MEMVPLLSAEIECTWSGSELGLGFVTVTSSVPGFRSLHCLDWVPGAVSSFPD